VAEPPDVRARDRAIHSSPLPCHAVIRAEGGTQKMAKTRPDPSSADGEEIEGEPRAGTGKQVSARGILSEAIAAVDPDEAAFRRHEGRLRGLLKPVDEFELSLVDRIIAGEWRLQKLLSVETRLLADRVERTGEMGESAAFHHYRDTLSTLTKGVNSIERSLSRAARELRLYRKSKAKAISARPRGRVSRRETVRISRSAAPCGERKRARRSRRPRRRKVNDEGKEGPVDRGATRAHG
jgi:hypothetical protein